MTLIISKRNENEQQNNKRNENDTNHQFRKIEEMKMSTNQFVQNNKRNENDTNHQFRTFIIKEMKMTLIISLEQQKK